MYNYALEISRETGHVSNVAQGKLWRYHYDWDFFKRQLFLYYNYFDEFEVRNPLKSYAECQKMSGVFVLLTCLPPHLIAKSENVYLSTLFHSKNLKELCN